MAVAVAWRRKCGVRQDATVSREGSGWAWVCSIPLSRGFVNLTSDCKLQIDF